VDLGRLARAVHLDAERLTDGRWLVSGGAQPHIVDLDAGSCDCADSAVRGGPCKHLQRVRLALGDAAALERLRALVPLPTRARRGKAAT
jgi:hypothetical protein